MDFTSEMFRLVRVGFTQAWNEGMAAANITESEMTDEERIRLEQEIVKEYSYVNGFADAVDAGSKANGGKLAPLFYRAGLWADGYPRIRSLAMTYAADDPKLKWTLNPAEHCISCKKLDGKVKRASFWKSKGVYPKAWDKLTCKGGCKCELVPTTDRCTPGALPVLP